MQDAAILDRFFQPILNRTRLFPQSVASFWAMGAIVMCCFGSYVAWMSGKYPFWLILVSILSVCVPAVLLIFWVPDPLRYNTRRERLSVLRLMIMGFIAGNTFGFTTHTGFSYWIFIPELLMDVFLWFAFCFGSCQTPPALLAKARLANTKANSKKA